VGAKPHISGGTTARRAPVENEDAQQQRAEELRKSEARFRAAIEAVEGVLWTNNPSGEMEGEQPGWTSLTGQSFESYQGYGWAEAVHPDDRDPTIEAWNEAVAERKTFIFDHRVRRRDGVWRLFSIRAVPIFADDGAVAEWVGVHTDVTEQRAAQDALREESRTLETLNKTGEALVAELDLERVVQTVTDAGVALTGAHFGAFFYNVQEAGESYMLYTLSGVERSAFEDFPMPRATAVFRPTFLGEGVIRSDDIRKDARYGKTGPHHGMPNGHLPVCSYLAVPVMSRSGDVIGGLFFGHPDAARFNERHERLMGGLAAQAAIAMENARLFQAVQHSNETLEQRVAERTADLETVHEALRQAQKMEAIGQLTGGIAHDFNNLLQGVVGSLDLIRRRSHDSERVERWAEAGLKAAERGAKLTGQLLTFSRSQRIEAKPLILRPLVENMRELLGRTLGPAVEIIVDLDDTDVPVLSDPTQLEMALLNLAINARDAMPDGGVLTIAAQCRHIKDDAELSDGEYMELSVRDTGSGMPPEVIARAFDPFFTTKEVGKGTGLGLSQVYGIARQAGGGVRIESRVGEGAIVRVLLRRTERPPEMEPTPIVDSAGAQTSVATVLVVDDDEDVRTFLAQALESLGYRVAEAANGPEALALLEQFEPDVLVVDFAMPGMNGAEVAMAARARWPDLPVIFASGYAQTDAIEEVAGQDAAVLRKPFRIDGLQIIIVDALNRRLQSVEAVV
jgi:PAS domain S-box-containing protein